MKIILRQDYESLGQIGSEVNVKDGYARNFLIPRGIVYPATANNKRKLEEEKKLQHKRETYKHRTAQELADAISKIMVVVQSKAGEEGRLVGSGTSQDLADFLHDKGVELDKIGECIHCPVDSYSFFMLQPLGLRFRQVQCHVEIT